MGKPYLVALINAPDLPAPVRIAAEVRYADALERALGGERQVVQAWLGMMERNEAEKLAHAAGAMGVAMPRGAYFDVELVPARV